MMNEVKRIPINIKHTLKDLRIRSGLNQYEASELLGISKPTLAKWEKNASELRMSDIEKITDVYDIPQDYIFFGTDNAFSERIKSKQ